MYPKLKSTANWLPHYLYREVKSKINRLPQPKYIYFCICDHYEPYWNNANKRTARARLERWMSEWPKLAEKYRDSNGNLLKYSFFYPEEEYQKDDLDTLAELCRAGYGEVEVHLHHDNDTEENLRRTLIDYKKRLYNDHGLLSVDKRTDDIAYAFIHGNWALNNSGPKGRHCGVNNETEILLETGCYADFTLPSAPNEAQTRKVNSIYYDTGSSCTSKSHDWGSDACVGQSNNGLLMVQGPLGLSWSRRKFGVFPRIENSGLMLSTPIVYSRVKEWGARRVQVKNASEHIFIKLYAHGTQENNMKMFFDQDGGEKLLSYMQRYCSEMNARLHFVSAREMVNVVHSLECTADSSSCEVDLDFRYIARI